MSSQLRTKKQKLQAAKHRVSVQLNQNQQTAFSYAGAVGSTPHIAAKNASSAQTAAPQPNRTAQFSAIFGYDAKLIYLDLARTVVITSVIVGVLIGLSIYLQ